MLVPPTDEHDTAAHAAELEDVAGHGIARHGRLPETTRARSVFGALTFCVVVSLVAVTTIGAIVYARTIGSIPRIDDPVAAPADPVSIEGGANILVVGSDDRTGQGAEFGEGQVDAEGVLNDVNMLVHIAEDQSSISVVSIPRDTIVDTPSCTNDEGVDVPEKFGVAFNSILQEGGLSCVRTAAEQLSGLPIQYAGMVQFRGVIAISNAIGGVTVCVANEIDDEYIPFHLAPGEHTLKGEDALKFLRTRHGLDGESDLARIANQQLFLSALVQQVKSGDTLANPVKLYGIASAVTQNMTLTSGLANPDTLVAFAGVLSKVPLERIRFAQLPVVDSDEVAGKVEPLEPDATAMWERIRADSPVDVETSGSTATAPSDGAPVTDPTDTGGTTGTGVEPAPDGATGTTTQAPTVPGQAADVQGCANG